MLWSWFILSYQTNLAWETWYEKTNILMETINIKNQWRLVWFVFQGFLVPSATLIFQIFIATNSNSIETLQIKIIKSTYIIILSTLLCIHVINIDFLISLLSLVSFSYYNIWCMTFIHKHPVPCTGQEEEITEILKWL